MPIVPDHPIRYGRLHALVVFALNEGWSVSAASHAEMVLEKPGLPAIYRGVHEACLCTRKCERAERAALGRARGDG